MSKIESNDLHNLKRENSLKNLNKFLVYMQFMLQTKSKPFTMKRLLGKIYIQTLSWKKIYYICI